jgi:chemotaxis protein histidine kinase CheA
VKYSLDTKTLRAVLDCVRKLERVLQNIADGNITTVPDDLMVEAIFLCGPNGDERLSKDIEVVVERAKRPKPPSTSILRGSAGVRKKQEITLSDLVKILAKIQQLEEERRKAHRTALNAEEQSLACLKENGNIMYLCAPHSTAPGGDDAMWQFMNGNPHARYLYAGGCKNDVLTLQGKLKEAQRALDQMKSSASQSIVQEFELHVKSQVQKPVVQHKPVSVSVAVHAAAVATKPATKPATQPAKPATQPATQPAKPATQPAKPATQPAKPATQPAKPATQPAKPATQPATQPAKPATQPAKPATQPAKPATQPAKPATQPAKPAKPVFSWSSHDSTVKARDANLRAARDAAMQAAVQAAVQAADTYLGDESPINFYNAFNAHEKLNECREKCGLKSFGPFAQPYSCAEPAQETQVDHDMIATKHGGLDLGSLGSGLQRSAPISVPRPGLLPTPGSQVPIRASQVPIRASPSPAPPQVPIRASPNRAPSKESQGSQGSWRRDEKKPPTYFNKGGARTGDSIHQVAAWAPRVASDRRVSSDRRVAPEAGWTSV